MIPPVVIKVGGSLLDWPELPTRLASYINEYSGDRLVMIVGGGQFADILRDLDNCQGLGEIRSHALALRVLDLTAHILAALLPGSMVVDDLDDLEEIWSLGRVPILAPRRYLDADDRSPNPLPHAWTTTTDAIAARLANHLQARKLALLKSTPLPHGTSLLEAARLGLVDPELPKVAEGIPLVTFCNLREHLADALCEQVFDRPDPTFVRGSQEWSHGSDDSG